MSEEFDDDGPRAGGYVMHEVEVESDGEVEDMLADYGLAAPPPEEKSDNQPPTFEGDLRMDRMPAAGSGMGFTDNNVQALVTPMERGAPRGGRQYNTGPKGVKADYEIAKKNLRAKRMREALEVERKLKDVALGKEKLVLKSQASKLRAKAQAEAGKKKRDALGSDDEHPDTDEEDSESDPDFRSDDEDDDAFKQYKLDRFKKLAADVAMRRFGKYERVGVAQLAAAVSEAWSETITIVHMYENHVEACARVHLALERLADEFKYVQFLRVRASECIRNFNDKGLPTFMVYKGKKHVQTIVAFSREFPGNKFSDQDVVDFFDKRGLLNPPDANASSAASDEQQQQQQENNNNKGKSAHAGSFLQHNKQQQQ
eukprot:TRINITY_DN67468_c8_g2_i2.p1 TRINITY_DN67468_c8_g2~~TRINITY_DN67468_c8_g2_i2.p1  ORF type:complete len:371 (+),score=186.39 TRINITY_DN67468_c8_g2_i2:19-1131(+)